MLVDFLIGLVVGIFTGILGLMPAYQLPASITDLGGTIGSSVAAINGVFPVVTLGACLVLMIGARLFIAAWSAIAWAYDKIPFKFS